MGHLGSRLSRTPDHPVAGDCVALRTHTWWSTTTRRNPSDQVGETPVLRSVPDDSPKQFQQRRAFVGIKVGL
jgi:hypothetical protein